MAQRIKDKLQQLGRPIRPLTISSRDGEQAVEVLYQRPTVMRDRVLRDAMKREYDTAVDFFSAKPEGGESQRDKWIKEFKTIGTAKVIAFIVSCELESVRADAIRASGKDPIGADATDERREEWGKFMEPFFKDAVKERETAYGDSHSEDELCEMAVDAQIDSQARERAFALYRLRLIQDSLIECVEGRPNEDGAKYAAVFETIEEIEEFLAPEVLEDLSNMISVEVRKARELPLK